MRTLLFTILSLASSQAFGQRLDPFLSKSHVANDGEVKEQLPYEKPIRYFDYIKQSDRADIIDSNYIGYYHYLTLTETVNEIGIRLISPVPELASPNRGDIETESFTALNHAKKTQWFDAGFILEYGTLSGENKFNVVFHLGENHRSKEVPPQPDGSYHNALYRLVRENLPAGEYRLTMIVERSEHDLLPEGSYLLEIGTVPPVKLTITR